MGIKKSEPQQKTGGVIKKQDVSNLPLKFSFKYFDATDAETCPPTFKDGYVQSLMERLKSLSSWTISDFLTPQGKAVRNHIVDWSTTARPDGFKHLNKQLAAYPAHQFSISKSSAGRVHGLLIDDTFHICWLDQDHKVYPGK